MRALNLLALTLITTISFAAVADDDRNICDRLIDQGASKSDIEICFKEFGKSKHRKRIEKEARERGEEIAATRADEERIAAEKEAERKKYIIKRFEGDELKYLGYAHFVAKKYTDQDMGSDEKVDNSMTSPKELCEQLGYEDAISEKESVGFTLSERIQDYEAADYQGIYINFLGKKKEVKWDDDEPAAVKHYTKIVCKRLRKSDEEIQSEEIQNAIRTIVEAQERSTTDRSDEARDDSAREELPLRVRLILDGSNPSRSTDRFTHESKSK